MTATDKIPNIFLSYCWNDIKTADEIDNIFCINQLFSFPKYHFREQLILEEILE